MKTRKCDINQQTVKLRNFYNSPWNIATENHVDLHIVLVIYYHCRGDTMFLKKKPVQSSSSFNIGSSVQTEEVYFDLESIHNIRKALSIGG